MDLKYENDALNIMPILYINNKINHNMKELKNMTQPEAMDWIRIHNIPILQGYTQKEAQDMTDLVRAYIDPKQRSCAHCGTTGNLRDAKNKFSKFYLTNKERIDAIAYQYHTNVPDVRSLSSFEDHVESIEPVVDQVEEIYKEINEDEIMPRIEEIALGEFTPVKKNKKKKK